METKVCSCCKVEKPLSEFRPRKDSKSGYRSECRTCHCSRVRRYVQKNKDKVVEARKNYYQTNRDKIATRMKEHYQANKTMILAQKRDYQQANKGKMAAKRAKYRAAKLKATPQWAGLEQILEFYECCLAFKLYTGREYHVDHIVPLQSKLVCGLHCEANLQVLEGAENKSKNNRYWPDMPT